MNISTSRHEGRGAGDDQLHRRAFLALTTATIAAAGCRRQTDTESVPPEEEQQAPRVSEEDRIRDAVIEYMNTDRFVGDDFLSRLTETPVKIERNYVDVRQLLFSMDPGDFRGSKDTFSRLLVAPESARFATAKEESGDTRFRNTARGQKLRLDVTGDGEADLQISGRDRYYFVVPYDQLNITPDKEIQYPVNGATYGVTPRELHGFITNKVVYGGYEFIPNSSGSYTYNFGVNVVKPGEPSLSRLANSVTGEGDSDMEKAQKLLNLVSSGVRYSHGDVRFEERAGVELIKRPNEVLMSGEGDCASKAITLASLYEQVGVDYRLIYMLPSETRAGHLTLLVKGDFGNRNEMEFKIGEESFAIGDPTVPGFRIGRTELVDPIKLDHMTYIQTPSNGNVLDVQTGELVRKGRVK